MSLLSKLFGEGKNEVLGALKEAAQKAGVDSLLDDIRNPSAQTGSEVREDQSSGLWGRKPESGFSWGEKMPAEENQYSFKGSYLAYFDMVFSQEFPQFRITRETAPNGKITVYKFWQGEREALVAELMSDRCETKKLRSACAARGVPYVRFYYDHHGWWNTRSYVASRTHAALGY